MHTFNARLFAVAYCVHISGIRPRVERYLEYCYAIKECEIFCSTNCKLSNKYAAPVIKAEPHRNQLVINQKLENSGLPRIYFAY